MVRFDRTFLNTMRADAPIATGHLVLAAAVLIVASVAAQDVPPRTSVGRPQDGFIAGGGEALPLSGGGYHWESNRGNAHANYGSPLLIAALVRAAAQVAGRHPGSDIAIHDISFENGGRIVGHGSHTSGRDADVAYYAASQDGARINPTESVYFLPDGRARQGGAHLDAERTTLFLAEMLNDPTIRVQYVFMHRGLQRLVVARARRAHPTAVARLTAVLRPPRGRRVDPHADHLHVRIRCPESDVAFGCRD